jgi:hypothetical protein
MWISHHLSSAGYLEYNKIPPDKSVYRYDIARVGIKDVSNLMPILYVDSSTGCGFFPSCPCVPTPNVHSDIWDHVESYTIHMILTQDWESLCSLNFKSHNFQTESHLKRAVPTYRGSTTLSLLVLQLHSSLRTGHWCRRALLRLYFNSSAGGCWSLVSWLSVGQSTIRVPGL